MVHEYINSEPSYMDSFLAAHIIYTTILTLTLERVRHGTTFKIPRQLYTNIVITILLPVDQATWTHSWPPIYDDSHAYSGTSAARNDV
jgi:hypothetical protein